VQRAYGTAVGALPTSALAGHSFQGWYTDAAGGAQVTVATKVTEDVTFFAHWKADIHTVTFNATGGSVSPASVQRAYGTAMGALPMPTRPGHSFQGWFTAVSGGVQVTVTTKVTADVTFFAHWTRNTYTVTFRGWDDRAIGVPQRVAHGAGAKAPDAPKRTGYTFAGWDEEFAGVTSDLTVTALYRANAYTVKLDAAGGKVAGKASTSVTRAYGQALGALANATRTGHDFLGWYTAKTGGQKATSGAKATKDVTYYAHWKARTYTVKLNASGGKVGKASASSAKRPYGSKLGRLVTPTRTGHDFLGWYTAKSGGKKVGAATRVAKSVTYWAHWKAKSYTVRLNASGGKVGKASTASVRRAHSAKLGKLPAPKRAGHRFLGWYTKKSGGTKVTAGTRVTKAVTLYAHWRRVR
jgi:uncharacterized repeat protein (TIGR02543 family)